jgi:hypothetical protein
MSSNLLIKCLGSALALSMVACISPSHGDGTGGSNGTGGITETGGTNGTGGTHTGGTNGTGGTNATGGTNGTGGNTGGTLGTGGGTGGQGGKAGGGGGPGGIGGGGGHAGSGGSNGSGGSHTGGSNGTGGNTGTGGSNSTGGNNGSGGSSTVMHPPPITNGMSGWASRYWDCCKPACGWKGNVTRGNPMNACDKSDNTLSDVNATNACQSGGSAFMCWSDVPWQVDDTLAYGFAAASGSNYACGRCYQIQFTGTNNTSGDKMGTPALNGKTMIVQVINNGGVQATQFDLLIPGGGVGALNACSTQWGSSVDLGSQYGGWLSECNGSASCVMQKCQSAFSDKPDLMDGCTWFLGWFGASNNPDFTYQKIACPSALTQKSGLSDPG